MGTNRESHAFHIIRRHKVAPFQKGRRPCRLCQIDGCPCRETGQYLRVAAGGGCQGVDVADYLFGKEDLLCHDPACGKYVKCGCDRSYGADPLADATTGNDPLFQMFRWVADAGADQETVKL